MAKRTNPFIEDFVPQSKVHVGLKQFNKNEDRLKKVYEKTLLLLFKGAKKCTSQVVSTEDNAYIATDKGDKMKQLFIGRDGTLLHSGNMVDSKLRVKQCPCGSGADSQCAYCEVSLCCDCQHTCVRCERSHCLHCTMNGLEGSEEPTSIGYRVQAAGGQGSRERKFLMRAVARRFLQLLSHQPPNESIIRC